VCPSHGYLKGRQDTCPHCDAITEVYSRVVGYLRPVHQWNIGKHAEFDMRKHVDITLETESDHDYVAASFSPEQRIQIK
jgi:ribonucleoside-triphosphate reductase